MKKLLLLACCALFFAGCAKEIKTTAKDNAAIQADQSSTTTAKEQASIKTGGVKPLRGTAKVDYQGGETGKWVLIFTNYYEVPLNLSEKYRIQNLRVDVAYVYSNKTIPCKCDDPKHYIEIRDITAIGSQPD